MTDTGTCREILVDGATRQWREVPRLAVCWRLASDVS
jgi:hypothetical protein